MKTLQATGLALLALATVALFRPAQAQEAPPAGGPPPLDLKAVALTAEIFDAIRVGNRAALVAALDHGADPNRPNWLGMSPMDWASFFGRQDFVALLQERGAKPTPGIYGSPVVAAAMLGHQDDAIALHGKGFTATAKRPDKATTIMLAAAYGAPKLIDHLNPDAAELAQQDIDGATALIYAARLGQTAALRSLLAHGATVDQADSHGRTPLMYAAMNGHRAAVDLLLAAKAKPNLTDKEKATALHLTARYCGDAGIGQSLLKAKAGVSGRDATGKTPLGLAQGRQFVALSKALLAAGARPEPVAAVASPQQAVQRSLVAMQKGLKSFLPQSQCVSCHHQGLGLAVLGAAQRKGFAVDKTVITDNVKRLGDDLGQQVPLIQLAMGNPAMKFVVPLSEMEEVSITTAYSFWGLDSNQAPSSPQLATLAKYVASQQQPSGNWRFTLMRGPMQVSFHTATAFQILGMRRYLAAAESKVVVTKATRWLRTTPPQTTEDRASQLLGLAWAGVSTKELTGSVKALAGQQRPDGGWGARPGAPSNALATGQALYGLRTAGVSPSNPVVRRAVAYLLRTQDENGSWFMNKTVPPFNYYFDAGFPGGESQYISLAATGWATLALMENTGAKVAQRN